MTEVAAEALQENQPENSEFVIAKVKGEDVTSLPKDLYIPPEALEVFLDTFEGPLDLLLYLIKRQNLDILEIPVAQITEQYMHYVELMKAVRFELAAEYLLMAAMLAEIKSRMLLPRVAEGEDDEEDPRAELVRRLQEYERIKIGAQDLDELLRHGRDTETVAVEVPELEIEKPLPDVDFKELLLALADVMNRAKLTQHHQVEREALSLRDRMSYIVSMVESDKFIEFQSMFSIEEGRAGVVVTFMACLELLKGNMIELMQAEPFAPIYIKAAA